MSVRINAKDWTEGFKDAYAGTAPSAAAGDAFAYASGRVEGEALRQKHQAEYEQAIFSGRRIRPAAAEDDHDG